MVSVSIYLLVVLVLAIILLLVVLVLRTRAPVGPVRRAVAQQPSAVTAPVLTGEHLRLYRQLQAALPEGYLVLPRVQVGAFLRPISGAGSAGLESLRERYVDLLLTDPAGRPLLAVNLQGLGEHDDPGQETLESLAAVLTAAGVELLVLHGGEERGWERVLARIRSHAADPG